jgi:hypothetical protein
LAKETAMNAMDSQTQMIFGVVVIAVIAIAAYLLFRKSQSDRLAHRFGPEYGRAVEELGGREKAETELKAREKRVAGLKIVPLAQEDAARFGQEWRALQGKFVDNPSGVVVQADQLVRELLLKRGYPMGDFERRAADISVDHPEVVSNYRAAQAIANRDRNGEASTEELRKAVVHYRALFAELLDTGETRPEARSSSTLRASS